MLRILYKFGVIDGTLDIDPQYLALPPHEFQINPEIVKLKAGRLATWDSNGYVRLATSADVGFIGFIVNDASGYIMENIPALASGKCSVLLGGSVCETDQVVEDTIGAGDSLWVGADGMLTKAAGTGDPIAKSRSKNSTTDKTIRVQLL